MCEINMKNYTIVNIKKRINGSGALIEKNILLYGLNSNDAIESAVEEWCENDPSGQSIGYSSKWEIVTEKDDVKKFIEQRLEYINHKINRLKVEYNELSDILKQNKNEF